MVKYVSSRRIYYLYSYYFSSKIHAKTNIHFGASKIPGCGFFFIAKATAAWAGLMQSSANREPVFWFIIIDLLDICNQMAPSLGSSRRTAPLKVTTGYMW